VLVEKKEKHCWSDGFENERMRQKKNFNQYVLYLAWQIFT